MEHGSGTGQSGKGKWTMQIVGKPEEYKEIMQRTKVKCKGGVSNIYFMADEIGRFISQGRLYVEESDAGCVFYVDEGTYYNTAIHAADSAIVPIHAQDKKCVVRYVYRSRDAESTGRKFSEILSANDFHKAASSVEVRLSVEECVQKGTKVEKWVQKMESQGFSCVCAEEPQFREIEQMFCASGVIKDYQMAYRTREEKKALEKGSYMCILDRDGNMCAASFCAIVNGITTGGSVAVKEEYKMRGLVPMFTYYRSRWLRDHHVTYSQGWIETDNMPSIRLHESLGYEFRDRYADEWILDARE